MNIYIAHSSNYDYEKRLYEPIKSDQRLSNYNIILPHEKKNIKNNRNFYRHIDLFIGEISYPSTGLGIELAFAYDSKIPIYCLVEKGKKYSQSVEVVTSNIITYNDTEDFLNKIINIIESR